MTWPTVDTNTTNVDATGDSPALARADFLDLIQKFNQMRAHVSTLAQTILNRATAALMRTDLGAAASGANADITTLTNVTSIGKGGPAIAFDATDNTLTLSSAPKGAVGVNMPLSWSMTWSYGAGDSIGSVFQLASSASTILGSGIKYSATANAFASAYSPSWKHAAVEVGYNGIKFYHNAAATVASGTNITMEEQVRFVNGGLQYSKIPGYAGMYGQFMCRARCAFNVVSGTVSLSAGADNVGSITDFGVGDFGVNFAVAMPDTQYTFLGSAGNVNVGTNPYVVSEQSRSLSQLRLTVFWVTNGAVDPAVVSVAILR